MQFASRSIFFMVLFAGSGVWLLRFLSFHS
ncbi:sortase B protein-sorting domain-containing protein [Synechococcus sp. MIT S9503]